MKIDIGTKLICISDGGWCIDDADSIVSGPSDGDIVTVRRIGIELIDGVWIPAVWLEEWPGDTYDDSFEMCDKSFAVISPE